MRNFEKFGLRCSDIINADQLIPNHFVMPFLLDVLVGEASERPNEVTHQSPFAAHSCAEAEMLCNLGQHGTVIFPKNVEDLLRVCSCGVSDFSSF